MDGAGFVRIGEWGGRVAVAAIVVAVVSASVARGEDQKAEGARQYDSIPLRSRTALENKPGGGVAAAASGAMEASRVVLALGAVIALIFGVRWAGRRFLGMNGISAAGGGGAVRVLSKTVLSPKQQLMLVQVGKRVVLVANTGVQMNALCEISDPEEVAGLVGEVTPGPERAVRAAAFLSAFGRAGNSYGAAGDVRFARDVKVMEREEGDASVVPPTRAELAGLLEKVRLMSGTYRKT